MYAYIPYVSLIIVNCALITFLTTHHKKSRAAGAQSRKKTNISRTVIAITLLFIILTFPAAMDSVFYGFFIEQEWGFIPMFMFDCLEFSYHGLSFVILMATNARFREEFFEFLKIVGLRKNTKH